MMIRPEPEALGLQGLVPRGDVVVAFSDVEFVHQRVPEAGFQRLLLASRAEHIAFNSISRSLKGVRILRWSALNFWFWASGFPSLLQKRSV